MDGNELLKQIEEFFCNMLPRAYISSEWNEDSISNAFYWGDFFEQIHKTYKDNQCKKKLDELIHSLMLTLKNSNDEICFEDLCKSTDILCEAFFENPYVENQLVESALLKIKSDKRSSEIVETRQELNLLCIELLESLKSVEIKNSERSFYSEVKALLFLNSLKTAVLHMTSEDEVEKYLSSCLETLCDTTENMVQLLHSLTVKCSENEASVRDIQEFAINWTMYKILSDKKCRLAQFMWKQTSKLREIALNSSDFLKFYLDILTEYSSSLICVLEDSGVIWRQRSSDIQALSFDEILNHFRSLFGVDDDVCKVTNQTLMNLLNTQPEMEIWKEIFSRVT